MSFASVLSQIERQHAFVVPACDLVVVNRVDRDQRLPEPKVSEVKELLSLTLKAGPFGH